MTGGKSVIGLLLTISPVFGISVLMITIIVIIIISYLLSIVTSLRKLHDP